MLSRLRDASDFAMRHRDQVRMCRHIWGYITCDVCAGLHKHKAPLCFTQ